MRTLSSRWLTASGLMTYCSTFSIRSWSSSSSRSPQSAAATTPQSISRSTLAASFQCTYKAVGGSQESDASGTGHSGLEENLYRGENGRHKELLRRNEPGNDESQRSLPSRSAGLMNLLGRSCGGVPTAGKHRSLTSCAASAAGWLHSNGVV